MNEDREYEESLRRDDHLHNIAAAIGIAVFFAAFVLAVFG